MSAPRLRRSHNLLDRVSRCLIFNILLAEILGRQPVRQLPQLLHGGWRHDLLSTDRAPGMRDNDDDDPYRAIMIVASTA